MPDDDHTADLGYAALTGLSMIGDDLTGSGGTDLRVASKQRWN